MIVKYGSYAHANNEVAPIISSRPNYSARGLFETTTVRWTLKGILHGDTQGELTTAIAALQTAYSTNGNDIGLYLDDGTTLTAHYLLSSQTLGGTRIVEAPSFPVPDGVEYVNQRTYTIVVEGDILVASENVVEFDEAVSFDGDGGPSRVFVDALESQPQEQIGTQYTTFKATQQGSAVGLLTWPEPSFPLWPDALHRDRSRVVYKTPQRIGLSLRNYRVEWNYVFESTSLLAGLPRVL